MNTNGARHPFCSARSAARRVLHRVVPGQRSPHAGPVEPDWRIWHSPQYASARQGLVAAMLRLAAQECEREAGSPGRRMQDAQEEFEQALAQVVAVIDPKVRVERYANGHAPSDAAYRAVQVAALATGVEGWSDDSALVLRGDEPPSWELDQSLLAYARAASGV